MAKELYKNLKVLIVDDFNSFRMTLNKIMYDLGFRQIDGVASGDEASALCAKGHYDLILCDYNLGQGKNGQQLLEELRINKRLKAEDVFILLSAETSRNVVMSAYDCEPDAYLTKPITTKVIEQRLARLLSKRDEMFAIYTSLSQNNIPKAIQLLTEKIESNSRHSMECQKLMAELYIETNQYHNAEKVYRTVLEVRSLEWAQVGLASVKIAQGEPEKAVKWLQDIIAANPSCMKAYDVLSNALQALNDHEKLQKNLQKAADVSPMSIGRQVSLAEVALENGDAEVAAQAYRKTIKFGANSAHDTVENQLNFAKSVTRFFDSDPVKASDMSKEAAKVILVLQESQDVDPEIKLHSTLLGSQLYALKGDKKKSQDMLNIVSDTLSTYGEVSIEIEIEIINTLIAGGEQIAAQEKIKELTTRYKDDQLSLEKLDPLLLEPISEKGKKTLALVNKKGIDAYKNMEYDTAIDYFFRVEKRYPRYLGIKLNLVQAIIGRIRKEGINDDDVNRCLSIFSVVNRYITQDNSQFNRYRQLQDMLRAISSSK